MAPGITTALYRATLRQAVQLNQRLVKHGVKDWPSFLYLLRRSNSEREMLNHAPEELFKASKEQAFLQEGIPDLTGAIRASYRAGTEKLAFGFTALKLLRCCNNMYQTVIEKYSHVPPPSLPAAVHPVGSVLRYEGATTVVVGYERDRTSFDVSFYHVTCLDGTLLEAEADEVLAEDPAEMEAAPALHDPNAFFVRWDAAARRFLPNRDLAWKYEGTWREEEGLTNEALAPEHDPAADRIAICRTVERRMMHLRRVAKMYWLMVCSVFLPGPPLVPRSYFLLQRTVWGPLLAAAGLAPRDTVITPPPPARS
eukprot:TRINITY_DN6516_c0_g5_i1.p1 TRINITY_DN6516_c0_g5~~TRINITY_DN6516_c0_g5_i1.p1  ORF type:complete len:311 (+),score=105.92 TRINITY_DN6516_c0_g5_i1:157-1089(+)